MGWIVIELSNFTVVRRDHNRNGGGVFVRNDIDFTVKTDWVKDIEVLLLDIHLPKTMPLLVGVCNRLTDQSVFCKSVENVLNSCGIAKREYILIGDFNTYVSKGCPTYRDFIRFSKLFDFKQLIKEPTRVGQTTQTIINLILVSDVYNISQHISDHFITYCTRKVQRKTSLSHKCIKIRSFKNYYAESFKEQLSRVYWSALLMLDCVDGAWNLFSQLFIQILNSMAPLKQIRVKQRSSPWLNQEILDAIQHREEAVQRFKKSQDQADADNYKKCRNDAQKIKIAKKTQKTKNP